MLRAIVNWFRAIGNLFGGKVNEAASAINADPAAVRERYSEILRRKRESLRELRSAIATLLATDETQKAEIEKRQQMVQWTERNIKAIQQGLESLPETEVNAGKEKFVKAKVQLERERKAMEEAMSRSSSINQMIEDQKRKFDRLSTEYEQLVLERDIAVAEIKGAKAVAKAGTVIDRAMIDSSSEELSELRQLRAEVKAEASLIEGSTNPIGDKTIEEMDAESEFDRLLSEAKSKSSHESEQVAKIPEA